MTDVVRRNHVTEQGRGEPTLVFGHGFGCDQRVWSRVTPYFEETHHCVLFDYVGSGLSEKSAFDDARYRNLRGYALDLIEIADALELEAATFIGHSVSTMIGVLAAIERPRAFERLVLLAPSPRYLDDPPYCGGFRQEDVLALFELMEQNFLGWAAGFSSFASGTAACASELDANLRSHDPKMLRSFAEATFNLDCRADLPKVAADCLVIQCADDDVAPSQVGEYVATHLRRCSYRVLDASGHLPHITHPREVADLIFEFLG